MLHLDTEILTLASSEAYRPKIESLELLTRGNLISSLAEATVDHEVGQLEDTPATEKEDADVVKGERSAKRNDN